MGRCALVVMNHMDQRPVMTAMYLVWMAKCVVGKMSTQSIPQIQVKHHIYRWHKGCSKALKMMSLCLRWLSETYNHIKSYNSDHRKFVFVNNYYNITISFGQGSNREVSN